MTERTARGAPDTKPERVRRTDRAQGERRSTPEVKAPRPGESLSEPAHLAAEVARLEAELTDLRAHVAALEACAERDPLTDLLNRRGLARELARAIAYLDRYAGRAALVYLDLDRFKPVNDRCGHAAGDAVLQAVAGTLRRHVRASDSVARLGGDEFAVLLWNLNDADAHAKASVLETEIGRTSIAWGGHVLRVTASAGAVRVRPDDTPDVVIARADAAMYARKSASRP